MSSFVSRIAQEHFKRKPTGSLLRECFQRLERGDWPVLFAGLGSECRPIQVAADRIVKSRLRHPSTRESFCSLVVGTTPDAALLHTLADTDRLLWCDSDSVLDIEQWLLDLLRSPESEIATAAAILLLRRFPETVPALVSHLESDCTPELARRLCLEGNEDTIWSLIRFFGVGSTSTESIPLSLGLALTPNWIAQHGAESSDVVTRLAVTCGYIDARQDRFPVEHFEAGLWFVNQTMSELPAGVVRDRVNELMWAILRETPLQLVRASDTSTNRTYRFDPTCSLDRGLFLAAVRELDCSNLEQRRAECPIRMNDPLAGAAVCLHAASDYVARLFIDEPLASATHFDVPTELLGRFLLSHAALLLEPDDDTRVEAELLFTARWKLMQVAFDWSPDNYIWSYTDSGTPRFPAASRIVRPAIETLPVASDEFISPCARAVHRMLSCFSHKSDSKELSELSTLEPRLAPYLTPLGVEIQLPKIADEFHIGWKETFRSFGIPSPRRPECRRMLEAALPPAASYHAPVEFLRSLPEIGVINESQDIGIHVSLQGDLRENARYLAFPQLFLNQPVDSKPRSRSGLRLVMSKGLVAINKDVMQCRWVSDANCRTEFRVFIAGVQKVGEVLSVNESILSAIRSTHLLGSAFLSPIQELNEIASEYSVSLETFVLQLPDPFQQLLHANFYEATGDPTAVSLLNHLPIVRVRESVRPFMADHDFRENLQDSLETIRARAAGKVLEVIARDHFEPG